MTINNQGNKYKFKAIIAKRSNKQTILAVSKKKNGEFGKPREYELFGNETPEDAIKRLSDLNGKEFRLA